MKACILFSARDARETLKRGLCSLPNDPPWASQRGCRAITAIRRASSWLTAAEQLVRIGFDARAVERELAAERAKSHRRLEQLKADAVAQSGVRADSLPRVVDARRAALGGVVGIGPPPTQSSPSYHRWRQHRSPLVSTALQ